MLQRDAGGCTAPAAPGVAGSITIATDGTGYAQNATVNISGLLLDSNGNPLPNVSVGIQLTSGSINHTLSATTNSAGNYSAAYQLLTSDVGAFTATASATYENAAVSATTSFQAFGAPVQVPSGNLPAGNTVWTTGKVYVIPNGGVTVPVGSTLTIQPGVVVKFKLNVTYTPTYLNIAGSLTANGTAAQPITFTSYRDDTAGGDTNGDGKATAPAAGDWAYIQFASGATGSVSYAVVRYGGSQHFPATYDISEIGALEIATQTAQPTLANLTLSGNITGIRFDNGGGTTPTVTGSAFTSNTNGIHVLGNAAPTITGSAFTDNTNAVWARAVRLLASRAGQSPRRRVRGRHFSARRVSGNIQRRQEAVRGC